MNRKPLPPRLCIGQVHVGIQESGKTYASKCVVDDAYDEGATIVVIDHYREWTSRYPFIVVTNVRDAEAALRKGWRLIVIQAPPMTRLPFVAILDWCLRTRDMLIVITEAHHYWPSQKRIGGGLDEQSAELIAGHRHYGCGFVADSQRPAQLSTSVLSSAKIIRVFAVTSDVDKKKLAEVAHGLDVAAEECVRRSFPKGQPRGDKSTRGWYVRWEVDNPDGPWPIERFDRSSRDDAK